MVPFLSVNAEALPHAPPKKSLPFQGRWLGEAETERSCQICDTLSVSLAADSIPTPFVPSGHFPLIGGIGPWEGGFGYKKRSVRVHGAFFVL